MIIKSLLFIIVCIFVYESFQIMNKMTEEYFISLENNKNNENFISLGTDPDKNEIAKIIATNCKAYPDKVSQIMARKPVSDYSLDTPYYAQFKPLEYNPNRKYYWGADILVKEGKRRSLDDETEIAKVKKLLDAETDPDKKKILEEEMSLFKWRKQILATKDSITKLDREMRDITTDYFPEEIGLSRPWIERHSHIPDYSY